MSPLAPRQSGGLYTSWLHRGTEHRYSIPPYGGKARSAPPGCGRAGAFNVDIIVVAGGYGAILAAKNATKTIPIVMVGAGFDPVEAGLVDSLARPGGNVTGITNFSTELGGKRLELLKEAVPKVIRVAVLYAAIPSSVIEVKEVLPVAARALGLNLQPWEVRAGDDFENILAALSKERPHGLYVATGPLLNANGKRIVGLELIPVTVDARQQGICRCRWAHILRS